jgi:hypothetical protein
MFNFNLDLVDDFMCSRLELDNTISYLHACRRMTCIVVANHNTCTQNVSLTSRPVSWYDVKKSIGTWSQITSTYKHEAPFLSAKIFVQWQIDTSMRKIQGFSHPEKVFTTANARKQDSDHAASSLYIGESRARSTGYSTTFLSFPTLLPCSAFTCPRACSGPCRGRRSPRMRYQ